MDWVLSLIWRIKNLSPKAPFPYRGGGVLLPSPRRGGVGGEVNKNLLLHPADDSQTISQR
jgi:hypothetical protein